MRKKRNHIWVLLTFASCFINHEEIFEKTDFTWTVKQHSGADQGTLMHFAIQESGENLQKILRQEYWK